MRIPLWAVLLAGLATSSVACARDQTRVRQLTATVRDLYLLPADRGAVFPQSSLMASLPHDSVATVERALTRLRPQITGERWLQGRDVAGVEFLAHELDLRLEGGGTFPVALVFRGGRLVDVDTREYLGAVTEVSEALALRSLGAPAPSN